MNSQGLWKRRVRVSPSPIVVGGRRRRRRRRCCCWRLYHLLTRYVFDIASVSARSSARRTFRWASLFVDVQRVRLIVLIKSGMNGHPRR